MNCWKTINIKKEYGTKWLRFFSLFIGLIAFLFLYVPTTMVHGGNQVNEIGILYLVIAIILLPFFNTLVHNLPIVIIKRKKLNLIDKKNSRLIPVFNRYPCIQLSKPTFLMVALAPTIFITIPGIIFSFMVPDFYVYFLTITAINIGITCIDFIYIFHLVKAPKESFVENDNDNFDILLEKDLP